MCVIRRPLPAIHRISTDVDVSEEQLSDVAAVQWLLDERLRIDDVIEPIGDPLSLPEKHPSA